MVSIMVCCMQLWQLLQFKLAQSLSETQTNESFRHKGHEHTEEANNRYRAAANVVSRLARACIIEADCHLLLWRLLPALHSSGPYQSLPHLTVQHDNTATTENANMKAGASRCPQYRACREQDVLPLLTHDDSAACLTGRKLVCWCWLQR